MSVCGGCSYPFEAIQVGEYKTREEVCANGCTFEDAAYRMQWAYDQLYERYKTLYDEHQALVRRQRALEDDGK